MPLGASYSGKARHSKLPGPCPSHTYNLRELINDCSTPQLPSMSSKSTAQLVSSKDGALIYADATGDPTKPCLVFLHGLALSAAVFDDIFANPKLTENFYLVRHSRVFWAQSLTLSIPLG